MLLPLLNVHAHDMHSILFSKLSIMRLCVCSSSLSISFFTLMCSCFLFFFSSRRRHTRWNCDWSSDVCSSDLRHGVGMEGGVRADPMVWLERGGAGPRHPLVSGRQGLPPNAFPFVPVAGGTSRHDLPRPLAAEREIGRASCRERV